MDKIPWTEITPEDVYLSRRKFMLSAGALVAGVLVGGCAGPAGLGGSGGSIGRGSGSGSSTGSGAAKRSGTPAVDTGPGATKADVDELGDKLTSFEDITHYNNYYEFSEEKEAVAPLAQGFPVSPWTLTVGGLVNNPKTYDPDALRRQFGTQEHIYRHRCVEGWSMVIPWIGFPLAALLKDVQPKAEAKFVRFETIGNSPDMPGQQSGWYSWPYVEGLRLDEAMNELALVGTGLYGKDLLAQNGAPVRIVVPWKYGFKSIKAIVKIDLVDTQPTSLWMKAAPDEYGFYSNVNPTVPHPRWSQSSERRIGELQRRRTLMFNGYEKQVAHLYDGMDLKANF